MKLTPEGKSAVEKAFSRHAAELESAMAVLNQSEKRELHVLLKKLGFAAGAGPETSQPTEDSSDTSSQK